MMQLKQDYYSNSIKAKMKTITQPKQEIEEFEKERRDMKMYRNEGNKMVQVESNGWHTTSDLRRMKEIDLKLEPLKATLKQTIAIKEMIEELKKHDCLKYGDRDDWGCSRCDFIEELLTKINGDEE